MQHVLKLIPSGKPGVKDHDLNMAEKELGATFPKDYYELLKLINCPEIGEWFFFPVKDPKNLSKTWDDIVRKNHDGKWDHFPEDYISIAENEYGDNLCLHIVNTKMEEEIYFFDHETGDIEKLAANLEEFIINLN